MARRTSPFLFGGVVLAAYPRGTSDGQLHISLAQRKANANGNQTEVASQTAVSGWCLSKATDKEVVRYDCIIQRMSGAFGDPSGATKQGSYPSRGPRDSELARAGRSFVLSAWDFLPKGLTGDTIKFGTDGLLKDGQNRLSASVRTGRPLTSHVIFGIDPQLFARMDIGKNRSGTDVFHIAGIRYAGHVAATVRWLLILTGDDPSDRGAQFSNEELLKAYREKFDPDRLERSIHSALAVRKTCGHPVGPLAALHYLFADRDQRKADSFFDEWASGRAKKVRAPSRYLQKRLVEIAAVSNNRVHENVRNALIIKAWNAFLAGHTVSKAEMQHAVSDPLPAIAG